ncbi:MAG: HAMP domain-containing histidine kinase [Clostridium sp.]|nr:HAMP domain-containing histidine kinase [Acetatifactor muris]MCM1526412.1 HAMP domain-containing histidine kinase [Bacteroides sp.]MCM1563225.1 HAMP domain-containing histidine kinase [Clostridium sp.]
MNQGGKRSRFNSLKWALVPYIPIAAVLAIVGCYAIGIYSNKAQEWYLERYAEPREESLRLEYIRDADGHRIYSYTSDPLSFRSWRYKLGYDLVSGAQAILMPLWVVLCIGVTGAVFYKREMEASIRILTEASRKISENCLDFKIEPVRENELGQLCRSFEEMRAALYENNRRIWSMMEGHKRLNAAFAHDMRTPLTVLRGYTELLTAHAADGKISEEKLREILSMMEGQLTRLTHYTQKMGAVRKLEDIAPQPGRVEWESFQKRCRDIGRVLAGERQVRFWGRSDAESVYLDEELALEVYENLISNAARYAESWINVDLRAEGDVLRIKVEDDGKGFSQEALGCAAEPFYREDREQDKEEDKERDKEHYGLGLYVCRMLCEKCGGELLLENGDAGAKVTAVFRQGRI